MSFPFQSTGLFGRPKKKLPNSSKRRVRPPLWLLRLRERISRAVANHERVIFDPLEPRLLLNADVLTLNLAHDLGAPPADHSLLVQLVNATEQINNQAVSVQRIQILDQSHGGAVLVFGDIGEISAVSILGGSGHDMLTIDANSFAGIKTPSLSFTGGTGQDSIVFDNAGATNWTLTGANGGKVTGGGVSLSFQNVGDIAGAGHGANTLTVENGGGLSGVFDGGAGGQNTLVFDNGQHKAVATSLGPDYDTVALDGQKLNYAHVGAIDIGDPASFDLSGTTNRNFELKGRINGIGTTVGLDILSTDGGTSFFNIVPTANQSFELKLGAGDKLIVDSINFDQLNAGQFIIDGLGAGIEFAGNLIDSAGVSASVTSAHSGLVTDTSLSGLVSVAAGAETIVAPAMNASIIVDASGSISGTTISLMANSASTESITTATDFNLVTSAAITTANTASIVIAGTLNANGALSIISTVMVSDIVSNSNAHLLHSVSVTASNSATVSFLTGSVITAGTLDSQANTSVSIAVTAKDVGVGYIPGIIPASLFGIEAGVNVTVTDVTMVSVDGGASISVGSGTIATGPPVAAYLAASDMANIATSVTLVDPIKLPVVGKVLVFSAMDSSDVLSRSTKVVVGDPAATAQPAGFAKTLFANGGDIALAAINSGSVSNDVISKSIGAAEIGSGATPALDLASVLVSGVNIGARGLSLNAATSTAYETSAHLVTVSVSGDVNASISKSVLTLGADGLSVSADDSSSATAFARPPGFDPGAAQSTDTSDSSGTSIAFSRSSAIIVFGKNVHARIEGSSVTSAGSVLVKAMDSTNLNSQSIMSADATTSSGTSVAGGGSLAVNMINGSVDATISDSVISTTGATSDVQVLAGDDSSITSRAETSAVSSGTSTSVSVAATIALNAIGWSFDTSYAGLAAAALGTLLGTDALFWTNHAPANPLDPGAGSSNVMASIKNSQITAGGALLVSAVAAGAVAATVSNISTATSTADGSGKAVGVGGIIGSNRVSRAATALLDGVTPANSNVLAGGLVTVSAKDTSKVTSTSTLVNAAIASSADAKTTFKSTDEAGNAPKSYIGHNPVLTNAQKDNLHTTTSVKFGDTVLFKAKYTTQNLFGPNVAQNVAIKAGETVYVAPRFSGTGTASQVYQYVGPALAKDVKIDLQKEDYSVAARWKTVSGLQGQVYKFMGPDSSNVALANGDLFDANGDAVTTVTPDYYDLGYWRPVPKAELTPERSRSGSSFSGSASGIAAGGIVVMNLIQSGAYAVVQNNTIVNAASLKVLADDAETITARIDATATAQGGSSFTSGKSASSGTSLAVNGSIAINEIIGSADAHVVNSSVTTTAGDDSVIALNASNIEATTSSAVTASSSGGITVAVGVTMADNTIGAAFQNLLDLTVDAIAGGSVLGSSAPAQTTAYVKNTPYVGGGALSVSATSTETINATVSNAATAAVEPSDGSKSYSAAAVFTDNQIQTSVTAYIDQTAIAAAGNNVSVAGALSVAASDAATITASSALSALGTAAASGPANDYASLALKSYQFTNFSGTKDLKFGDQIAVQQADGTLIVYRYMGVSATRFDLQTHMTGDATPVDENYTDLEYWKPMSAAHLKAEAEAKAANPPASGGASPKAGQEVSQNKDNTSFGSASLYVLFDYNNIVASTGAWILHSAVQGASVAVSATEAGTITATDASVVTTGSGGFGAGGVVATNHVQGGASASVVASGVTATTGAVAVSAANTSAITAKETTALTASGSAVTLEAAFNVIGWSDDNLGSLALDALLGTDTLLGTATPLATTAFITSNSTVLAATDVTVSAIGSAKIDATVSDQADAGDPGATATLNVGGILATNKIASTTKAWIGTAPAGLAAAILLDSATGLPATAVTTLPALDGSTVNATAGTLSVTAGDTAALAASSSLTLSATATSTALSDTLAGDYTYTDKSGTQKLKKGTEVYAAGKVHAYKGTANTPAAGDLIDLAAATFTDTVLWTENGTGAPAGNSSAAESKAIGFVFVLNDVNSTTDATIGVAAGTGAATIAGGTGISVKASEAGSIDAHTISNLTSSGGANGSGTGSGGSSTTTKGGGLALGGAVDTNIVNGHALATIQGATLSAGTGGILVDANNTTQLNAETLVASSTSGGGTQTAAGLSIAFNSVGYASSNLLFNAVDALIGGDYLKTPTPNNATAFIVNAKVLADAGDLSVTAESSEQVNATVSNAAQSQTSALHDASSRGFGGVLASNSVAGSAIAYVDNSGLTGQQTIAGKLNVAASDDAGIFSNAKLVSSAIITSDGGTGKLDEAVAKLNGVKAAGFITSPGAGGSVNNNKPLVFGDRVLVSAGYDTPKFKVGAPGAAAALLHTGNVIGDGTNFYRYVGTGGTFDLSINAILTANTTDFLKIGGKIGQIYQYMGPPAPATGSAPDVDINNTDYTDKAYWKAVPQTNAVPSGLTKAEEASSNESTGKASSATAVGGMLVINNVVSDTQAFVRNANISAGSVAVSAIDNAVITAVNDSTVVAQASTLGSGPGVAVNGIIATNLVQNAAHAIVASSTLAAGDTADTAITIFAENNATLNATNQAQTSGGGKAAGVVLAFNSIGYKASNFLFNAVDALLGNNLLTDVFGNSPMTHVTAESYNSTLTAANGGIAVTATLSAQINALTTNQTSSIAAALENASSTAIGLILATNKINETATALVQGGSANAGGALKIAGNNSAQITAQDTQVVSSTLQSIPTIPETNNLLTTYANQIRQGYQYTTKSGTQSVTPGAVIYDATADKYYIYLGTPRKAISGKPQEIDLGTVNFTISTLADALNITLDTPFFAPFSGALANSALLDYLPNFSTLTAKNSAVNNASTTAVGAIFVLNDINSAVIASAASTSLASAGDLSILANSTAAINAINDSSITSSSSNPLGSGGSGTGVNVTLASNYVLDSTIASATSSTLTTRGTGSVAIAANAAGSIDSEMSATTIAATNSIGIVLSFNTIGVQQPVAGWLQGTVDALFGTQLAAEQPDLVQAYALDTAITSAGAVSLTALDTAQITSSVTNAAMALSPDTPLGSAGGVSVGATIALNHIATSVQAFVANSATSSAVEAKSGDISIISSDQAKVNATVITPVISVNIPAPTDSSKPKPTVSIGVSIVRNIIDGDVVAADGRITAPHAGLLAASSGAALTADSGNVKISAADSAEIKAISASAAVAVTVSSQKSTGFAGAGAVAINTILGTVDAVAQDAAISATGTDGTKGSVTVAAQDQRKIDATVAALSAAASTGKAIAIGAAVAVNLIGWRGTVADETQISNEPIVVKASVNGGSIIATNAVSITTGSTAQVNALTVAVAVAIGITFDGGSDSGKQGEGGQQGQAGQEGKISEGKGGSPTNADEAGKGSTSTATGGKTTTSMGQANGTTVNEGKDVKGGAETNQAEEAGGNAGQAQNTAGTETGAKKGSATSQKNGIGQGGGILAALGGIVTAVNGNNATPDATFTTPASQSDKSAQSVKTNDTVKLDINYDSEPGADGKPMTISVTKGVQTLATGNTVQAISGALYRYIAANGSVDLEKADFTDSATWAAIGGTGGGVYKYIGKDASLDINNQNYSDGSIWEDVTGGDTTSEGAKSTGSSSGGLASLGAGLGFLNKGGGETTPASGGTTPSNPAGASNPKEPATPTSPQASEAGQSGSKGATSQSSSSQDKAKGLGVSAAGVYAENKIAAQVTSTVANATTITILPVAGAKGVSVTANDNAVINSIDGAAAVTVDFSNGESKAVTIGISIARNTIQDSVNASISGGVVNTNGTALKVLATEQSAINSVSVAAALSVSISTDSKALAVAGGASLSDNLIGVNTTASITGATLGTALAADGDVTVSATDSSKIDAIVAAVAGSVAISGTQATAVGIGASLAHNRIGDGADTGTGTVSAAMTDTAIHAGLVDVEALSSQKINAIVLAAGVGISGGGETATAVTGAGAIAFNEVAVAVSAIIDGGDGTLANVPTASIAATGVKSIAVDSATINSVVEAGSVAISFGDSKATSVAIGVSFSRNSITDPVTATIQNVPSLTTSGGDVIVTATESATINAVTAAEAVAVAGSGGSSIAFAGGGALAANFITEATQANIANSTVGTALNKAGAVTISAEDSAHIIASDIAAAVSVAIGADKGVGVAIGVALAYNQIGDLTGFGQGAVTASITGTSVQANGVAGVTARSDGEIDALTASIAGAVSGGGGTGVGVAAAGVAVFNIITVGVSAYIDGGGTHSVTSGGVHVEADDTALIKSLSAAAAVSATLAGSNAVSVSIGLSIAGNTIVDPVAAYITGVTALDAGTGAVTVSSTENQTINALSIAAAIAIAIGGSNAVAIGGGGASAVNVISADSAAYISGTTIANSGSVSVTNNNSSTINALVGAVAASVAVGSSAGVGVAIGIAFSENFIGSADGVSAYIANSSVTSAGNIDVEANASEKIQALTAAGSLSVGVGGTAGVAVALAGVGAVNTSAMPVTAYVSSTATNAGGSLIVKASDSSSILAYDLSAAVSIAAGGTAGVAVSIALSIASNTIADPVLAYITSSANLVATGGVDVEALEIAKIHANVFAVAASVAAGSTGGVAVAGGGAVALNVIASLTNAYISGSTLVNTGGVTVKANEGTAEIYAEVGVAAAAVGVGGTAGVGVAIGVTVAVNLITAAAAKNADQIGGIAAFIKGTNINSTGVILVNALSNETIVADNAAITIGIGGGGTAGVAVAVSGAIDFNVVAMPTTAFLSGGTSIHATGLGILARDSATISATGIAAAVTVGIGGAAGVAVSIAVTIASNTIADTISAYVTNATGIALGTGALAVDADEKAAITAVAGAAGLAIGGGGAAGVAVGGGGAIALNLITAATDAHITGTTVNSAGNITVSAEEEGSIKGLIAAAGAAFSAGGAAGVSVAISAAVASNNIVGLSSGPAVKAYVSGSNITQSGLLGVNVSSHELIKAFVASVSATVAIGGAAGVGVSFGGSFAFNTVALSTAAYISGGSYNNGGIIITSDDSATIQALVAAAAFSVSGGAAAGVSVSVALSLATNLLENSQTAYIENATITAGTGTVGVEASGVEQVTALGVAAAIAAGGGIAGVAVSGAATAMSNNVKADVEAYIKNSTLVSAGDVAVAANFGGSIVANVDSAALSLGVGLAGVGVAVGIAIAQNAVGDGTPVANPGLVTAYISNSSINASGAISVITNSSVNIDAEVGAIAAAISGGFVGVSVAAAGTSGVNTVSINNSAYITGDAASGSLQKGITGAGVLVSASDSAIIRANVLTAAISAAFGAVAVAVPVGIALSTNVITDNVTAYIAAVPDGVSSTSGGVSVASASTAQIDAFVTAASVGISGGAVAVSVAAGGAIATNIILGSSIAFIADAAINATGGASVTATDNDTISAKVLAPVASVAIGAIAVGAAVGASLAENFIGFSGHGAKSRISVKAFTNSANINTNGSALNVSATNTSHIDANVAAVSAAITGGAIGASLAVSGSQAVNEIAVDTQAYVTGGTDYLGAATITASDNSSINANLLAGSAAISAALGGSVALGLSIANNVIDNITKASINSADIEQASSIVVSATENANVTANSVAVAISAGAVGASGGGATAFNTITTSTAAFIEGSTVKSAGNVSALAADTSTANVTTGSGALAAGLFSMAVQGSIATVNITNNVDAHISGGTVKANGASVIVTALATPQANVTALGLSAGTFSVGGSVAIANVTTKVSANAGGTINAGSLQVTSRSNVANGGNILTFAGAASGGLISAVATDAESNNTTNVTATIAAGAVVALTGALILSASGNTQQRGEAANVSFGFVAVGASVSHANVVDNTSASIGNNANISADTVTIGATGTDNNFAKGVAGSGGVVAGNAVAPTTSDNATTTATVGASATVNVTGGSPGSAFSIGATHNATVNNQVIAAAFGLLSGSGAFMENKVNSSVTTHLDGTVNALAVLGTAKNFFNKPVLGFNSDGSPIDNMKGDTGGLAAISAGKDSTEIAFSTVVDVGGSAHLNVTGDVGNAGDLNLSAFNSFQGYDQVTFKTGGALAGALAFAKIVATDDTAKVLIEGGAHLDSAGRIILAVDGTATLTTQVNTDTYGAVAAAVATSTVDIAPNNIIDIGNGAVLTAQHDVSLLAGEDAAFVDDHYNLHAYTDAFAGALIPISAVDAHAFVVQNNYITVEQGATLLVGGSANLIANSTGIAEVLAQAKASSWASDLADGINTLTGGDPANEFKGTGFAVSHGIVTVNGAITTGINSNINVSFSATVNAVTHTITSLTETAAAGSPYLNWRYVENVEVSSPLFAQYRTIQGQIGTYKAQQTQAGGPGHSAAIDGQVAFAQQELDTISTQLVSQGLASVQLDGSGGTRIIPLTPHVNVIEVFAFNAQAGQINLYGNQIAGTGSLKSASSANVTITNNTPASLQIDGITIPQLIGGVYANGVLQSGTSLSAVNVQLTKLNRDETNAANAAPAPAYTYETAVAANFQSVSSSIPRYPWIS